MCFQADLTRPVHPTHTTQANIFIIALDSVMHLRLLSSLLLASGPSEAVVICTCTVPGEHKVFSRSGPCHNGRMVTEPNPTKRKEKEEVGGGRGIRKKGGKRKEKRPRWMTTLGVLCSGWDRPLACCTTLFGQTTGRRSFADSPGAALAKHNSRSCGRYEEQRGVVMFISGSRHCCLIENANTSDSP